jgi:hypothetical protein
MSIIANMIAAAILSIPGLNWGSDLNSIKWYAKSNGFSSYEYVHNSHLFNAGSFAGRKFSFAQFKECSGVGLHTFKVFYHATNATYQDIYDNAVALYTKKYGQPRDSLRFFKSPYYDGDGYEFSAVRNGKAYISSFWEVGDSAIMIEVTNTGGVAVVYQDSARFKRCKAVEDQNSSRGI